MIQGLKKFVDVYNIMVGPSVVNAYCWDVPVLLVNSADHVLTIPAWIAIGHVESVAEIRKIYNVGASPPSQLSVLPDHVELLVSDAIPSFRMWNENVYVFRRHRMLTCFQHPDRH